MKVTKHEHAFLQLELNGNEVLVDPGIYSPALPKTQNVVAITLSHVHDDHSFEPHLKQLVARHPGVKLFGPKEVAEKLSAFDITVCYHGDRHVIDGFTIDFLGYLHQEIHRSIPLVENLGVQINNLYYPGDSYTIPETQVDVLACPSSAPWLKIGDVIDFLDAIKPKRSFATHNALLSEHGHTLNNSRISERTRAHGGEFFELNVGQALEI